jgi:hypothetical protein
MSLNFCDLLVLGSDLSGVIAATLLAKRGMNVLVIDDDEDSDRFSSMATGLDTRAFKSLVSKLMIPESRIQMVQENKVACQVILPKHRIDLAPSKDFLFKEIDREFPKERELFSDLIAEVTSVRENTIDSLFSFLPVSNRKESKEFTRWVQELPDQKIREIWEKLSPTLQTFLKLQLRFMARGPLVEPLTLQLILYLSPENCTTFSIKGGVRELKKIFYERLEYFGGMVHPLAGGHFKISAKGREIKGVKLDRYSHPTRCRFLLGNIDYQHFYGQLPKNLWSYFAKRKMEHVTSHKEQYLVQYEIDKNVLPAALKENVVLIDDVTKPLEGLNYLEINLSPATRDKDETSKILSVAYSYSDAFEKGEGFFEELHGEIERRLHKLIPFSENSIRRLFPRKNENEELFPDTGDFPVFQKMAKRKRMFTPSFFTPPLTTPFKNGVLLGPNLLDWLGMEGKILGALKGVDLIWEREAKTKKN